MTTTGLARTWQVRAERDPVLDELITAEGRGKIDPRGYRSDRPNSAVLGAPHNPHYALAVDAMFVAFGVFLFVKLSDSWLGIVLLASFAGLAVLSGFFIVRRIPAWHRARRVARDYVAEHGDKFPPQLRVWN